MFSFFQGECFDQTILISEDHQTIGDNSQPAWEDAPKWQRDSATKGVEFCLANPDAPPSANHDSWLKVKEAEGRLTGDENLKDEGETQQVLADAEEKEALKPWRREHHKP